MRADSARIVETNTDPPSSANWFAELKRLIEEHVPKGENRDEALEGIKILDPANLDEETDKAISAEWAKLEKSSPSVDQYEKIPAKVLQDTGCDFEATPYVIRGLLRTFYDPFRFYRGDPNPFAIPAPRVAAIFFNEAQCPGVRGLSENDKARLRRIQDRASPVPPSPPDAPPNQ
jgi:hypothetical protein